MIARWLWKLCPLRPCIERLLLMSEALKVLTDRVAQVNAAALRAVEALKAANAEIADLKALAGSMKADDSAELTALADQLAAAQAEIEALVPAPVDEPVAPEGEPPPADPVF